MSGLIRGNEHGLAKLCGMCYKLTGALNEGGNISGSVEVALSYYTNPRNVQGTGTTNCPICVRLHYEIMDNPLSKLQPKVYHEETYESTYSFDTNVVFSHVQTFLPPGSLRTGPFLQIDAIIHGEFARLNMVLAPRIEVESQEFDVSTGSVQTLAFAKEWVERCLSSHASHPRCHNPKPDMLSDGHPTRLLEIDQDGIGCRLCLVSEMQYKPKYATLSHCWGKIEMFKLLRDNFVSLCQQVPTFQLCKTFREAIKATVALGFNYLWIDSLCIIQDNPEDWNQEAVRMATIYGNATVNLAATKAQDGREGLFAERDVRRALSPNFRIQDGRVYGILDHGQFERCITSSPLSGRAWCFQERFLAQRNIFFGAEQIFCQCNEQTASESWPEGHPTAAATEPEDKWASRPKSWNWYDVVSVYSRAQLTKSSDKLVALSGVARWYQNLDKENVYLAGLWTKNLEMQLFWRFESVAGLGVIEDIPYRAPSWSWMSTDQPISWRLYHKNNLPREAQRHIMCFVRTLAITEDPASETHLGSVKHLTLQLSGSLLTASIYSSVSPQVIIRGLNDIPIEGTGEVFYDKKEYDNEEVKYLLPMFEEFQEKKFTSLGYGYMIVFGLILAKAEGRARGNFVRIGVFDIAVKKQNYKKLSLLFPREPDSSSTLVQFKEQGEASVEPYNPIAHTCSYCSQLVVKEEEKSPEASVFDLGVNCCQATVAGAAGCLFFQTIFDLEWTDYEEVRPQINWDKSSGIAEINFVGEEDLLPQIPFRLDGERKPPWFQGDLKSRYTYLKLYSFKGDATFNSIPYAPSNLDPGTTASQEQYATWLTECRNQHQGCWSSHSNSFPSRLIKIILWKGKLLARVVACPSETPSYATLSYCWGGDQVTKATRESLPSLEAGIEAESLSPSIYDTIVVASNLGLEYIWVDAICIQQDDDDKVVELTKMLDIYRGALLTIVAGVAEGSGQGFLGRRDNIETFALNVRCVDGSMGKMLLGQRYDLSKDPIHSRAWTLQEGLHSNRVLYFGSRQAFWYCQERVRTDGGSINEATGNPLFALRQPYGRPRPWKSIGNELHVISRAIETPNPDTRSEESKNRLTSLTRSNREGHDGSKRLDEQASMIRDIWWSIIGQYTQRSITVLTDKLVAICRDCGGIQSSTR